MAKRKAVRGARKAKTTRKSGTSGGAVERSSKKRQPSSPSARLSTALGRKASARKSAPSTRTSVERPPRITPRKAVSERTRTKAPRPDRVRRTLEETVPTPPSSLNMNWRGSTARTGRAELAESLREHAGMTPAITGGDADANLETAYFSGDQAPGGDNPTPDQNVVDDIGKALGVEYHDSEELKSSHKIVKRDKHRWELDPASSEDYKDRK